MVSLTPGQPCLARYSGDGAGRWYRALVEQCNPADNTATVGGVFAEMRGADVVEEGRKGGRGKGETY